LYRPLQRGEATIHFGIGNGLRFDPAGGNPGYALGAIALPEQELLARHLKPGQTFYDIGANVGFFAVLGAHLVGSAGRVYAFEPFPSSAKAVADNAARNGFDHVKVQNCAVGRQRGSGRFSLDGTVGEHHLADATAPAGAGQITVPIVCIDDLVKAGECTPPDFVMIDVEGAEIDVLLGMSTTIAKSRPTVVCEVHGREAEFADTCEQIFSPQHYTVTQLDGSAMPQTPVGRWHALMIPKPLA
jgi:FkbM family methyltransferase